MAVEAELTRRLGEVAGFLHTGRSRNDQVALDLRLFVRERCADVLGGLSELLALTASRAEADRDVLLPAYTHRQRAQPVSAGYWWAAYGAMFARDVEALRFVLAQVDASPLGVGAIAGTSLPTDRRIPQKLLGFSRLTVNGLDTVGDRDFELDFVYAASRFLLHASRLATDVVDFTSSEFGFLVLDDAIACGSSLMPQKKNPDVFELVRGRSGQGIGALVQLFTVLKGLPGGYNRDLQEDRAPLLGTAANVLAVLGAFRVAIPRIRFDPVRCRAALDRDHTQATDVAEALVRAGVPFRSAYRRVGALVRKAQGAGLGLMQAQELARELDPELASALASVGDVAASRRRQAERRVDVPVGGGAADCRAPPGRGRGPDSGGLRATAGAALHRALRSLAMRHFLRMTDLDRGEIRRLFARAAELKRRRRVRGTSRTRWPARRSCC